jgi:hypothetical protein
MDERAVTALEMVAIELSAIRKLMAVAILGGRKMRASGAGTVRQSDGSIRPPEADVRKDAKGRL